MAHAVICHVEQCAIDNHVQPLKVSCPSSLLSVAAIEETETTSPKSPLILTVCKNGKEYSMRKREKKATKRPSNRLEETSQPTSERKRRHLDEFPLVLTPVCSSLNLSSQQDLIYSPIIFSPTPCRNLSDITAELSIPITPKSSSETSVSCDDEFSSQSDLEEQVDSNPKPTRHRSNSNIVQNSSEVSTPIPLTSSTTPYSSSTCSTVSSSQYDSLSSPSSPYSSYHPSEHFSDDKVNSIFNSWMDCYELKKKEFSNSRNKL